MRYNNITPEMITEALYNIFSDDRSAVAYLNSSYAQYTGLLGWAGSMSPYNRVAFLDAFGVEQVERSEQEARERVKAYREAVAASSYHRNEMAADAAELSGTVPAAGSFVWAVTSWMKGEGGPLGEIKELERMDHAGDEPARVLVEVAAVEHVTPAEFLNYDHANEIARRYSQECGGRYDESDPADLKGRPMAWTVGVLVECAGRWYIIDAEGYSYTRYILYPSNFRAIYRDELEDMKTIREDIEAKARAEAQREADKRRADYLARCAKWAPLMQDVTEAQRNYEATPWRDKKANAAALRKLGTLRRRNISAMLSAAFPGVKFSVKKWDGWGGSYEVTWTDGPTVDTLKSRTDLDLFERSRDTFDSWDDSTDIVTAEFTEFSDQYFGCHGQIRLNRETSEAYRATIRARILSALPDVSESEPVKDIAQQSAICALFRDVVGCRASYIVECLERDGIKGAAAYIARCTDEPTTPEPEPTDPTDTPTPSAPTHGGDGGTRADALELVEYSEKALALFGDSRAIADELKAIGGRFNAKLTHNGERRAGWIFSKKKRDAVAAVLASLEEPAPADLQAEPVSDQPDEVAQIREALEEIRAAILAESVSYGEISYLQAHADYIAPGDTLLLEWAGVPEHSEDDDPADLQAEPESDGAGHPEPVERAPMVADAADVSPVPETLAELYQKAKTKRPDAVALFRCGDWCTCYGEEADAVAAAVGIIVTIREGRRLASFPWVAIDTYLPRMIRQGLAVCIIEVPRPTPPTPPTVTDGDDVADLQAEPVGDQCEELPAPPTPTDGPASEEGAPSGRGTIEGGAALDLTNDTPGASDNAVYGDSQKSLVFETVAASLPDVSAYKLMYLWGAWIQHCTIYAETDAEAIHDADEIFKDDKTLHNWNGVALMQDNRFVKMYRPIRRDENGKLVYYNIETVNGRNRKVYLHSAL